MVDSEALPRDRIVDSELSLGQVKFSGLMAKHTPQILEASVALKRSSFDQKEKF